MPRGRPVGSKNKQSQKKKLSPTELLEAEAPASNGNSQDQSPLDNASNLNRSKRGRPRIHTRKDEEDIDDVTAAPPPTRRGRPPKTQAMQGQGPHGSYKKAKKIVMGPLPRFHGRPIPGQFPYNCDCGIPEKPHLLFSVAEWESHMTKEMVERLHARSIAVTTESNLPARFAGVFSTTGRTSLTEEKTGGEASQQSATEYRTNDLVDLQTSGIQDQQSGASDADIEDSVPNQPQPMQQQLYLPGASNIPAREQRKRLKERTRAAFEVISKARADEDRANREALKEARRIARREDRAQREQARLEEATRRSVADQSNVARNTIRARAADRDMFDKLEEKALEDRLRKEKRAIRDAKRRERELKLEEDSCQQQSPESPLDDDTVTLATHTNHSTYSTDGELHAFALRIRRMYAAKLFYKVLGKAQEDMDVLERIKLLGRTLLNFDDVGCPRLAEIVEILRQRQNQIGPDQSEPVDTRKIITATGTTEEVQPPMVDPEFDDSDTDKMTEVETDEEFDNDGISTTSVEDLRDTDGEESSDTSDSDSDPDDPLNPRNDEFDYTLASRQPMDQKLFASIALLQMRQDGGMSIELLGQINKLVTALLIHPSNAPYDYRTTRKKLAQRTNIRHVRYEVCSNNCFCYAALPKAKQCPECGTPRLPAGHRDIITYDHIPVIPRIRLQYSDPDFAKLVTSYRRSVVEKHRESGVLADFWNGKLHKEQLGRGLFMAETDLGFALYTDGVQVFKVRVSFGVWPIVLVNLSLPPELRYLDEHLIIVGIIPGPDQPVNMNSFLYPLVEEFMMLQDGVEDVHNGSTNELFTLRAHICVCCADQKGREKVQGTVGTPAYSYCPYCHAHGHRGPNHTYCPYKAPLTNEFGDPIEAVDATFGKRFTRDGFPLFFEFDIASGGAPRKDHKHFVEAYDHVVAHDDPGFTVRMWGVNDFNILHNLTSMDSSRSYPVEEMHLLYIGACKQHFDLLRGVTFTRIMETVQEQKAAKEAAAKKGKRKSAALQNTANPKPIDQADVDVLWNDGEEKEGGNEETDAEDNSVASDNEQPSRKRPRNPGNHKTPSGEEEQPVDEQPDNNNKKKRKKVSKFVATGESFGILPSDWWEMNHDMNATRKAGGIPTAFGYNIRGIAEFCGYFKAEEWKTFFTRYFPIYFRGRFPKDEPEHYLRNMDFIRILQLCGNHYLSPAEVEEIGECVTRFAEYYERCVYQRKWERIIIYTSTIHHLGHLKESIENCGPMYVFACWVVERVNNMLARGTKNKRDANRNISINMLSREQFNHLKYTYSEDSFQGSVLPGIPCGSAGNEALGTAPIQAQFERGFGTAAERACAFASFRMYLQISKEAQLQAEGGVANGLTTEERERQAIEQTDNFIDQRNKLMGRKRGREFQMRHEFENSKDHRVAAVIGTGTPYNKKTEGGAFPGDIRTAMLRDLGGAWLRYERKDWESWRVRPFVGCTFTEKNEFSASVFSIMSANLRSKGNKRGNSLAMAVDRDAYADPELPEVVEAVEKSGDAKHDRDIPKTVCEVAFFFRVEKRPVKKQRKKKAVYVNPLYADAPIEPVVFDDETIFAAVRYQKVVRDGSFLILEKKSGASDKLSVIPASDLESLLGFVIDRGQRVLVDKLGPVYYQGEFNPSFYADGPKSGGKKRKRQK